MKLTQQTNTSYAGVWVFAEQRNGILKGVSRELAGLGRRLADQLGVPLTAVLLGELVEDLASEIISCGADRVLVAEHPLLKEYQPEVYAKVLADLVVLQQPEILLIGSTSLGRDFAPRLAIHLRTGLMADCMEIQIDHAQRTVVGIKPVASSDLLASIVCPRHRPQIVTVRPRVLPSPVQDLSRKGAVERITVELQMSEARTRLLKTFKEASASNNLEEASVVVAAGQGVACREDLALVEELASSLGAALGGTRPVVDAGLLPESVQIGQSGKTVRPRLYIACGVHGAAFHVVGMRDSDIIVAINDDPHAPIFQVATLGIVGDLREVVPLLTEKLKEVLGR